MFISELESLEDIMRWCCFFSLRLLVHILFFLYLNNLNKAEGFVDISANRKIIDCDLPQSSRFVDHKQTSEAEMMLTM